LRIRTRCEITAGLSIPCAVPLRTGIAPRLSVARAVALSVLWCALRTITIAAYAARWRAEQFPNREFAAVIFGEFAKRFRCACNFVLGDHAVMVLVERGNDGRHVRPFTAAVFALGMVGLRLAFAGGRSGRAALRLLCNRESRRQRERECDDGCVVFHGLVLLWLFVVFFGSRLQAQQC
jgi:hypothetical protein